MPKLKNEKHEAFCWKYVECLNATNSYREIYKTKDANANGSRVSASQLMKKDDIIARIDELMAERGERVKLTADNVLVGIKTILDFDITELMEDDGKILLSTIRKLPPEVRKTILGIKRTGYTEENGTSVSIDPASFERAQELAFKHLGLTHKNETQDINLTIEQVLRGETKGK